MYALTLYLIETQTRGINEHKLARTKAKQAQLVAGTTTTEREPAQPSGHKRPGTNGDQQTNGDDKRGPVSSSTCSSSSKSSSGSRGATWPPPPPLPFFLPLFIYMYIHYFNKKKPGEIWVLSKKLVLQVLAAPITRTQIRVDLWPPVTWTREFPYPRDFPRVYL